MYSPLAGREHASIQETEEETLYRVIVNNGLDTVAASSFISFGIKIPFELAVVVHACNANIQEAETGGLWTRG